MNSTHGSFRVHKSAKSVMKRRYIKNSDRKAVQEAVLEYLKAHEGRRIKFSDLGRELGYRTGHRASAVVRDLIKAGRITDHGSQRYYVNGPILSRKLEALEESSQPEPMTEWPDEFAGLDLRNDDNLWEEFCDNPTEGAVTELNGYWVEYCDKSDLLSMELQAANEFRKFIITKMKGDN